MQYYELKEKTAEPLTPRMMPVPALEEETVEPLTPMMMPVGPAMAQQEREAVRLEDDGKNDEPNGVAMSGSAEMAQERLEPALDHGGQPPALSLVQELRGNQQYWTVVLPTLCPLLVASDRLLAGADRCPGP